MPTDPEFLIKLNDAVVIAFTFRMMLALCLLSLCVLAIAIVALQFYRERKSDS